jgi:uncharacterized protein
MIAFTLLGLLVGAVMGLTGAGGGVLAVPALVGIMGWSMQQAAPVALVAVASGALIGTIDGLRRKLVRYRAAFLMAAAGVPLTALGLHVAAAVPDLSLKILFSLLLLFIAWRTLRQTVHDAGGEDESMLGKPMTARVDPQTGRFAWSWPVAFLLGGIGASTGFASGLLGVGGGFVLVPLLQRFTNLSIHSIVATALMVIALVSSGGVVNALLHGVSIPMPASVQFAGATVAGMLAVRRVAHHLPALLVTRAFGGLLILTALGMVGKIVTSV